MSNIKAKSIPNLTFRSHKFGLVYAGLGWIIFRDSEQLPKDLIFELHYLGGTEESYTLNFSRPGNQVIGKCDVMADVPLLISPSAILLFPASWI